MQVTRIAATDRSGLERLARYLMRPPLAAGRLRFLDADHLTFALKTRCRDGTTHLIVSAEELIEKLAALVPPPHRHLIRYHGVLAPHAADRAQIVPTPPAPPSATAAGTEATPRSPVQRLQWAQRLARVLSLEVAVCPRCGGHMRMIAARTDPDSIRTYLTGVGLPADAPVISPARPPPQQELEFAA